MLLEVLKGGDCILFTMLLVASTVGNTLVVLRRYLLAFFHSCTFVECIGNGQAAVPVLNTETADKQGSAIRHEFIKIAVSVTRQIYNMLGECIFSQVHIRV